jgi:hypothetical protein
LINHIPVKNQILCECKKKWEQEITDLGIKSSNNQGELTQHILFGNSEVLHYGPLGPVVKYRESEESFPAIILAAANGHAYSAPRTACKALEPSLGLYPNQKPVQSIQRIEFARAHTDGAIRVCPLKDTELTDVKLKNNSNNEFKTCQKYFGAALNSVRVILFGGDYGRDDTYVTPLGVKPGVAVHAYTFFSISKRLLSAHGWLQWKKWFPWGFDIILGLGSGFAFHWIWHKFHYYRRLNRLAPKSIGQP